MPDSPPPPTQLFPTPPPGRKDPSVIIEDIFVFLAIPVLWLFVFRLSGIVCNLIGIATLVVLIVILARRIRRINEASDQPRPPDNSRKPSL